jgi:hypothetical protein
MGSRISPALRSKRTHPPYPRFRWKSWWHEQWVILHGVCFVRSLSHCHLRWGSFVHESHFCCSLRQVRYFLTQRLKKQRLFIIVFAVVISLSLYIVAMKYYWINTWRDCDEHHEKRMWSAIRSFEIQLYWIGEFDNWFHQMNFFDQTFRCVMSKNGQKNLIADQIKLK